MRRKDREITQPSQILDIVRRCEVCRLAMHDGEYPYIVPMNFGMTESEGQVVLYFHCASAGKKLDLLRANPHVAFEMDCDCEIASIPDQGDCTMTFRSVMGQGIVTFVEGEEKLRALDLLVSRYHPEGFDWDRSYIPATTVLKLTVHTMTAKHRPDPRKKL